MSEQDTPLIDSDILGNGAPFWSFPRSVAGVRLVLETLTAEGLGAEAMLEGTGLTPAHCTLPDGEIAATQELQVIRNVLALMPHGEGLGWRLGSRYRLTAYGMWGYALMCSRTLGAAAELALRYIGLTYAFARIRLEVARGEAIFVLGDEEVPQDVRRFVVERDLSALMTLAEELVGRELVAAHAKLELAFPPPRGERLDPFPSALTFNASAHRLKVPVDVLALPLPMANETTAAQCEALCSALLAQRRRCGSTSETVRARLLQDPSRLPSLEDLATLMGVTSRTLRRRLDDEGVSYRGLVDEVRATSAEALLRDARLTLAEIAQRLGFAETASFNHAFQRWKRISPSRYRQAMGIQGRKRYPPRRA